MSGVVGAVKDTFFGGAEKDAAKQQTKALEQGQEFVQENIGEGREQIRNLFPQARESAQGGFQSALDVFGGAIPAQANVFQQGNVGAQQMLSSGLPQIQNALLGLPTDLSFAQPQQLNMPDLSFLNQQLPEIQQFEQAQYTTPQQAIAGPRFNGPFGTSFDFSNRYMQRP